jgi:hypothetical protein
MLLLLAWTAQQSEAREVFQIAPLARTQSERRRRLALASGFRALRLSGINRLAAPGRGRLFNLEDKSYATVIFRSRKVRSVYILIGSAPVMSPDCPARDGMRTILCYGDSITCGYNPVDGSRFPFEQRWPGVLQAALGSGFRIIEESLSGRTVATDSWILPHRDGRSMLTGWSSWLEPTTAARLIAVTWARLRSVVPRCFGPCRRRRLGRRAECRTCS